MINPPLSLSPHEPPTVIVVPQMESTAGLPLNTQHVPSCIVLLLYQTIKGKRLSPPYRSGKNERQKTLKAFPIKSRMQEW